MPWAYRLASCRRRSASISGQGRPVLAPCCLRVHAEDFADFVPRQSCGSCHVDRRTDEFLGGRLTLRIDKNHRIGLGLDVAG